MSDLFFPSNMKNDLEIRKELYDLIIKSYPKGSDSKALNEDKELMAPWLSGKKEAPMGVYLKEYVFKKNPKIGFTICTDTSHHSKLLNPLYVVMKGIRLHDDFKDDSKDWGRAYDDAIIQSIFRRALNISGSEFIGGHWYTFQRWREIDWDIITSFGVKLKREGFTQIFV